MIGVVVCLVQSLLLAVNLVLLRMVGRRAHPLTLLIFVLLASVVISPFFALYNGLTDLGWYEIGYILLMGFAYFFGHFFLTKSYQQKEKIESLRMLNYLQVFFAFVLDVWVVKDMPEAWSLVGTVLIIVSNVLILY